MLPLKVCHPHPSQHQNPKANGQLKPNPQNLRRETAMPSSILEKEIIYFSFCGRVNIDEPQGVEDIARSYIVLRPLPIDARLGEGPLEGARNVR
jgi:hypothetical protein